MGGLGVGNVGFGVGVWAQTPNPKSPIPNKFRLIKIKFYYLKKLFNEVLF